MRLSTLSLLVLSDTIARIGMVYGTNDFEEGVDWMTALDSPNEQNCLHRYPKDEFPGADLVVSIPSIPYIQTNEYNDRDCEVQEGCVDMSGRRRVLRFDARIENHGTDTFTIGSPTNGCYKDLYDCDGNCHNHCHLKDFSDYYLMDGDNTCAAAGGKATFCIVDRCDHRRCSFQGLKNHRDSLGRLISANTKCGDTYRASLDCQYIDISCVCPGTYTLQVKLRCGDDWALEKAENCDGTKETGSIVEKEVTIPRDNTFPAPGFCGGHENIYGWVGDAATGRCKTVGS